ncbi:MAG: aldo/keto reductase [Candidatus Lokiarchaeota archaeon]|nr:aldo/keto reductase [Candidatus Lokiarchaeota archaeon]
MSLNINTKIKLNNGVEMPLFGLGTWEISEGDTIINVVRWAISNGYRHIDTARIYGNENGVGKGLKISLEEQGINREDIFITTKLWIDSFKHEKALKAFDRSLNNLGLDYVDLYLLHWPEPTYRQEAWKALESIFKEGKARSIGVSNYYENHLDELLNGADIIPAVNQVELTPYLYLKELKEYCDNKGIMLEAYSPLTRGKKLKDPKLMDIANKYGKSSAQILIRWGLQHKIIEIPKSSNENHIIENSKIFDFTISEDDMANLDKFDEGLYLGMWNPTLSRWK